MTAPARVTFRDSTRPGAVTTFPAVGLANDYVDNAALQALQQYTDDRAAYQFGETGDRPPLLYSNTLAGLNAAYPPGTAGRVARVTDGLRGLHWDNGVAWVSVTGHADVRDFATSGTGTKADPWIGWDAIVWANGTIYAFPAGWYKATSPILMENLRGVTLSGASGQWDFSGTHLVGVHTGKAVVSLVGSLFTRCDNITIEGSATTTPKTGLLLGRSSAASAGNHTFTNIQVQGSYTVAGVYNVASEENVWINPLIFPAAAPIAAIYFAQGDGHSIGGLTGSSMEENRMVGGTIGNGDNTADSTTIFVDAGASTGHLHFYGTFLSKNGGDSYIKIRLGNQDGEDTKFPISFYDITGERGATAPTNGLLVISTQAHILSNLTATNLNLDAATQHITTNSTVTLANLVLSEAADLTKAKPSVFGRIDGGRLIFTNDQSITIDTMYGSDLGYNNTAPTITTHSGNRIHNIYGGNSTYTFDNSQVISTIATGTAPLSVASRTPVANLLVEGLEVVATASIPAAGASQDGKAIIEDVGAGDRNLIFYAGGQRFRIDGGAAF